MKGVSYKLIWQGCDNWSVVWRNLPDTIEDRILVEDNILEEAYSEEADLIAIATEGRHGLKDAIFGSTTERVVRLAGCPVLAVPLAPVEAMELRPAFS